MNHNKVGNVRAQLQLTTRVRFAHFAPRSIRFGGHTCLCVCVGLCTRACVRVSVLRAHADGRTDGRIRFQLLVGAARRLIIYLLAQVHYAQVSYSRCGPKIMCPLSSQLRMRIHLLDNDSIEADRRFSERGLGSRQPCEFLAHLSVRNSFGCVSRRFRSPLVKLENYAPEAHGPFIRPLRAEVAIPRDQFLRKPTVLYGNL